MVDSSNTFAAEYEGWCPRCMGKIKVSDRVRYVDGDLVHAHHNHVEPVYEICDRCWLTKPCECD